MSSLYSLLFNLDADVTLLRRPLAPLVISMPEILLSKTLVRLLDKYTLVFVLSDSNPVKDLSGFVELFINAGNKCWQSFRKPRKVASQIIVSGLSPQ